MLFSICSGLGPGVDHNVDDERLIDIVSILFYFIF